MIFSVIPHSTIFGAPNMMTCDVWGSIFLIWDGMGQDEIFWGGLGWQGSTLFFLGQGSVENFQNLSGWGRQAGALFLNGAWGGTGCAIFLKVSSLVLEMMINGMLCGTQNNQHDVRDTISSHLQLFAGFCDRRRTLVAANRAFQCSSAILGNNQGLTGRVPGRDG